MGLNITPCTAHANGVSAMTLALNVPAVSDLYPETGWSFQSQRGHEAKIGAGAVP